MHVCFLSLLIKLPIEVHKGIGFLVEYNAIGREAVFVSNPITNPSVSDYAMRKYVIF
jgi:hypothetical protein